MENVGTARSALTVNIFIIFLLFRSCLGTRLGLRFFSPVFRIFFAVPILSPVSASIFNYETEQQEKIFN